MCHIVSFYMYYSLHLEEGAACIDTYVLTHVPQLYHVQCMVMQGTISAIIICSMPYTCTCTCMQMRIQHNRSTLYKDWVSWNAPKISKISLMRKLYWTNITVPILKIINPGNASRNLSLIIQNVYAPTYVWLHFK